MNEIISKSIFKAVDDLIANAISDKKLRNIISKHTEKIHFIPIRYRVLSGILQSMNIQFGNFLETAIRNIVMLNPDNEIIEKYSGKKTNKFRVSKESIALVDNYIVERQRQISEGQNLERKYKDLLSNIIETEKNALQTEKISHDIDLLFMQKSTKKYIFAEIKYNDDHDTGKFIDINRKFLLTFALLVRVLNITDINQIKPILMYFNNKRMKGNIYVPETSAIFRGEKFFKTFTTVNYQDIDNAFLCISKSTDLNDRFDKLCAKVLHRDY